MLRTNIARRTWAQRCFIALVAAVVACSEDAITTADPAEALVGKSALAASDYETLDEEFARLSAEVPGGFAGLYYDSTGAFVIALTDISERDAALSRLEPVLRIHSHGQYTSEKAGAVRVQKADYRFDELKNWREQIERVPLPGLVMVDINERLNRVELGFENPALAQSVLAKALVENGIPAEAVLSVPFARVPTTQTLSDLFSAIPGGVTVKAGAEPICSMAAAIKYNGTNAIIASSHCSQTEFGLDGVTWVHYSSLATLGSEIADRGNRCPGWPYAPCRWSDAAIVGVNGYPIEIGKIARTKGVSFVGAGNDTIDVARPRFDLLSPGYVTSNLINGDRVHRDGWKRGWVSGLINATCTNVLQDTGWYMMCSNRYFIPTEAGDSGGSVFVKIACPNDPPTETNCAKFAGIHWGGNLQNSYYSPVANILSDFSSATFQFMP